MQVSSTSKAQLSKEITKTKTFFFFFFNSLFLLLWGKKKALKKNLTLIHKCKTKNSSNKYMDMSHHTLQYTNMLSTLSQYQYFPIFLMNLSTNMRQHVKMSHFIFIHCQMFQALILPHKAKKIIGHNTHIFYVCFFFLILQFFKTHLTTTGFWLLV